MNLKIVCGMLARLILAAGLVEIFPLLVSLAQGGPIAAFLISMGTAFFLAYLFRAYGFSENNSLTPREGMAITSLGWIFVSILYAFPYIFSGTLSPLDGLLESISGLTGTGATVIPDLTVVPSSILLFRAMTHWLGGLGIVVIFVALFPLVGRGGNSMVNAESTGPTSSKALPRIKETAAALFYVYVGITAACIFSYMALGMGFLEAVDHAFSTIATGGFSTRNESIAYYHNPALELCISFFMIISSANFGIYVDAWKNGFSVIWKDTEFRVYVGWVALATLLMTASLVISEGRPVLGALRDTFFQAASLSSTTGFVSADYDQWTPFAKYIIFLLIFFGGCAGSTAGGLKIIRLILLFKTFIATMKVTLHPRQVVRVSVGDETFSETILFRVLCFFFVYVALGTLWALIFMAGGLEDLDAIGLAFTTMSNVGPAFGLVGPTFTYADLPDLSKAVVCLSMLLGRLESYTLLVIFIPSFWKRSGW